DAITVAHPHIKELMTGFFVIDNTVEQAIGFAFLHACITELVLLAIDDLAAELFGHGLHAVANTQHRYALLEHTLRRARSLLRRHRFRAAGENDAGRIKGANFRLVHVPGANFTVDTDFTNASCNQLGVLGTEIENQNPLGVNIFHGMKTRFDVERLSSDANHGTCITLPHFTAGTKNKAAAERPLSYQTLHAAPEACITPPGSSVLPW